ncbi:HTH domain-containing protein [Zobellia uliginosa]|uniref:HTH domain-containing protein n=1 Tax=Zobellia uliginosa TaxID=143224 RepID=UPI001C073DB0|nr:HTH domain-containing protein [Zobellia uliginosa]MBU2947413.1 hypothetical protein [Zobellia uliginosa]
MTYHGLAENILEQNDKPLTANEIWKLAVNQGLDDQLNSSGKTPWATLGSRLYVIARDNPDSPFKTVGKRPKRFYLKNKKYNIDFKEYEEGKTEEETDISLPNPVISYLEKDLHHFLTHFGFYNLNCYCKTINHSKSEKKSFGEWVHPDMVGCVFPIDEWHNEVLELSSAVGNTSVKFISFELKKELNLSTLREKFFQTVSNSSWANESYIVAAEISQNEDFLSELSRLSSSFGVGVIKIDVEDPNSSKILYSATNRENLDWETMNKLTVMNKDFMQFVKRVRIDLKSNEIRKEKYDKILDEEQLDKLIKN